MKTATETSLVRACLDYLALMGIVAWRNNSGATRLRGRNGKPQLVRFGHPGSADIIGALPPHGRMLTVECKVGYNKLSAAQAAFLQNIRAAGGLALVVRDLNDLIDALDSVRGDT